MESTVNWTLYWKIENTDKDGFGIMDYYNWYGFGVIVFAAFGCSGNIFALAVFLHPHMRSPCAVFICALLIADMFFLVSACLVQVPGAWLTLISVNDPNFWNELARGQNIYVTAYGAAELARALVVWYTVAVLAEQYCVIYKPAVPIRFSSSTDKVLKICMTILNLTILVHLVHFFKLVLNPIDIKNYKRICLSDIYIIQAYRVYDFYGYFICFVLTAWFIVLSLCIAISMAVLTGRYNLGEVLPDQRIFRVFKNGRSIKTSLSIGVWFVICFGFSDVTYIVSWFYDDWDSAEVDCVFRPGEIRFNQTPAYIGLIYDVLHVLNSSFRFPFLYASNSSFRRILRTCVRYRSDTVRTVSKALTVRPRPRATRTNQAHDNQAYQTSWI